MSRDECTTGPRDGDPPIVTVESTTSDSAWGHAALALADANRKTLGFFPAEAFRAQADAGSLLVAIGPDDDLRGYILYRVARERAAIAHLCVASGHRRAGVARCLLNSLRKRMAHLRYIEARCRTDYEAHQAWKELGFAVEGEVPGRGTERLPITVFRYDLGHRGLFSPGPPAPSTLRCALDASVIIGLQDETDQCSSLLADWLGEEVEFVVTAEVRNDLSRTKDPGLKARRLAYAATFNEAISPPNAFEAAREAARQILPRSSTDARHLARSSAAGVDAFLTTDSEILLNSGAILDELGLRVLHPNELVRELDALRSTQEYAPVQLAGTELECVRASPSDLDPLVDALRYGGDGEKSGAFRQLVHLHFGYLENGDVTIVRKTRDRLPLGLLVGSQTSENRYEVHALRVPPGRASDSGFMRVLARHLAFIALDTACRRGCRVSVVTDRYLHPVVVDGLVHEGFRRAGNTFARLHLSGVLDIEGTVAQLKHLRSVEGDIVEACTGPDGLARDLRLQPQDAAHAECRLWPLKVRDLGIKNYVIPIQARWAEHLFDSDLAAQGLFGADLLLGLAREAVYYRSAQGLRLRAPARLLWYVSEAAEFHGSKAVRACSVLTGVQVDTAQRLYRRFRRLGVWRWADLLEKAGAPDGALMALEFGQSERFTTPIPYEEAKAILGVKGTFQAPIEVPEDAFMQAYERGFESG